MKRRDKAKEEAAEKAQAALKAEVEAHKAKKEAEAKAAAEKAKKEAEDKAAAEKARKEAEAKAADNKKKDAEAKAAAEAEQIMKRRDKAKEEAAEKAQAALKAEVEAHKAKKEAEAKAAEEKAKATAEEKKKAAEEKVATAFEERFPELAKAIADAELSAEKQAEVDVLSANLMASSDALNEVTAREAAGNAQPAEKLDAEIECLTNYTAILAAVPSPENETLLADKQLELHTAREDRLLLAQKEFEEGKIDSDQLRELEEKYVKADAVTEAEPVKAAKKEKKEPFWGYKKHKPLPCLVIVANYRIPRKVIAEYLRTKYDVPYVLLPSDPGKPSKDDQVYFSGGKKNSGELEVALPAPQLSQFIAYLRPETVIILGNDSYINPVYRLAVPEGIRKVEFSDAEWKVNTVRLDEFFRRTLKTDLSDHYLDYLQNQDKHNAE
ncbi:MAG: hypothetical protein IKC53_03535 [Lentisphaeria bacterium]|nr:hypothetical protein [Lentisphaeria bacterium]